MRGVSAVAILLSLGVLSACGGGGGGGGPGGGTGGVKPTPATPFFVAGETMESNALAQSVSISSRPPSDTDGTVSLTLDDAGTPDNLVVDLSPASPGADGTWSGDEIVCSGGNCALADSDDVGTLANPTALGWSFQTFGYWIQEPTGAERQTIVFSTGSPTPADAVLSVATATYSGKSGGLYVNGADVLEHRADMTADVDFGARTIDFRTTGTQTMPVGTSTATAAPHLNMTGSLAITGMQFTGEVNTANSINGTATGRFYGPDAQEIGGVYLCNCAVGTEYFTGAFGGKR
jgi:hypothetical protein